MRISPLLSTGLLCIVLFNPAAYQSSFAGSHNSDIAQSWQEDYARIQKEMAEYQAGTLSKAVAEETMRIMDENARILSSDRDVLDVQLRRLQALVDYMRNMPGAPDLRDEQDALDRLMLKSAPIGPAKAGSVAHRKSLFMESRALARRIALQNPLLDFDEIIFNTFEHQIKKNNIMNHDQDVGYSAAPGGGIGIIKGFKINNPTGRDLMKGVKIQNGPYQGLDISKAKGSFNSRRENTKRPLPGVGHQ